MNDKTLLHQLLQQFSDISTYEFQRFLPHFKFQNISQGVFIRKGQYVNNEVFILKGTLRTYVISPNDKEITLDFFFENSCLSPYKVRTKNGQSRINVEALTSIEIATIDRNKLLELMTKHKEIHLLATKIMETDFIRKSDKEIALLSMTGSEKLDFLRMQFPNIENLVAHNYIASYLGMTNVNLSRLRGLKGRLS